MINISLDDINKPNLFRIIDIPTWASNVDIISLIKDVYTKNVFYKNTLTYFVNNKIKSIYPIILFDNSLFVKYPTIQLHDELINSIKLKLTKIVFFYILEGYFGDENHHNWLINFCIKNELKKENVLIVTANLNVKENNFFEVFRYNFFGNQISFPTNSGYKYFLNSKVKKHFLCFNGIPRLNRLMMFAELQTNKKLIDKSISTLRNCNGDDEKLFYKMTNIPFYLNYDSTKNYYHDLPNWLENKIGGAAILNNNAHKSTFVNIVTETLFDENHLFLSEKTYKPIYTCQPFIIFGNPYLLKKLKELGYKTFDKWWDESYDNETDLNNRFKKIVKILEYISGLSLDDCETIKREMIDTLIHNHKLLLKRKGTIELYSILKTSDNVNKSII
jgi:hypothetical protein